MNREIKLRAYKIILGIGVMKYSSTTSLGNFFDHDIYPNKDWHIMQYTGLKDKNGKEIYEGDICKYQELEIIQWRWDEQHAGFWPRKIPMESWSFNVIHTSLNCEVIGNIHENTELIK